MMSAIIAVAVTVSPPPPTPWSAREPISQAIDCESPASIEATVNSTMLPTKIVLRPKQVAELAGEDRGDGLGEEVRRHHPAHVLRAAEVADDGRQGRRDDRGVECRELHPAHDHGEGDVACGVAERLGASVSDRSSSVAAWLMGAA
jgi:hypothetical protein